MRCSSCPASAVRASNTRQGRHATWLSYSHGLCILCLNQSPCAGRAYCGQPQPPQRRYLSLSLPCVEAVTQPLPISPAPLLTLQTAEAQVQRRTDEIVKLKAVTSRLEAALLDLDAQICIFADV